MMRVKDFPGAWPLCRHWFRPLLAARVWVVVAVVAVAMAVPVAPALAGWSRPVTIGSPAFETEGPNVSVASNGAAALMWRVTTGKRGDGPFVVRTSVRASAAGRFSVPADIPGSISGSAPRVAIRPSGEALAAWYAYGADGADAQREGEGLWAADVMKQIAKAPAEPDVLRHTSLRLESDVIQTGGRAFSVPGKAS